MISEEHTQWSLYHQLTVALDTSSSVVEAFNVQCYQLSAAKTEHLLARNTLLWGYFHENLGFMFLNLFIYTCTPNKTALQL